MDINTKRPFIPRDKPRSWVIGVLSGLIGLLVAGPIMANGAYFEFSFVKDTGITVFIICWLGFAISWLIFAFGMVTGKYRDIHAQDWNKQLW